MRKKIIQLILICSVMLFSVAPVYAADATVHMFWSVGCPHCAKEKEFLVELQQIYPQIDIKEYEITQSRDNAQLLEKLEDVLGGVDVSGVPFTIVGKNHFTGYLSDETTGKEIEKAVQYALENGHEDIVAGLSQQEIPQEQKSPEDSIPGSVTLPIMGTVDVKVISLPFVTILLALLDGFNPCAMWTLLFLISLLLGMKDRKRMWILGIAFIVSSAGVYFLFLAAWLNLFLFLGFIFWVRIIIACVALGAGIYNIRDYWIHKDGGCSVMGDQKRQKVFEKIRAVTQKQEFILALGGIVLLAIAVNMVELVCSAGLPAIYTQILTLSNLPKWQYYLYLGIYTFIFMLDDLIVFGTAMVTLQAVGIQSKYSRYSRLIGGILMLAIGVLLLFKPEYLMFG